MACPSAPLRAVVLSLVCLLCVRSQKVSLGSCPSQSVVSDFDAASYLGTWYENRKYFAFFQGFGRCVTAEYTDAGNDLIGVTNRQISLFGFSNSISGQAKLADPSSTEAKLDVQFFSDNPFPDPTAVTSSNYWVLDTDYTSYAVVWNCKEVWSFNSQYLWILTRDREPAQTVVDTAVGVVSSRGLNVDNLRVTRQTDC